jgi:hypothetical protein
VKRAALLALLFAVACGNKSSKPSGVVKDAAPATPAPAAAALTLEGAWTLAETQPIVDKTQTITLAPDLSGLGDGERACVTKLLAVGDIIQELYEEQRHKDAAAARALVAGLDASPRSEHLRMLYRLYQGPIATTLDNKRVPFLGVAPIAPGKQVYPWGIEAKEIDTFLSQHPDQKDAILAPRTVVRRADAATVAADLATLDRHPALDTLHPGLRAHLESLRGAPSGLYAVPYSVAFADRLVRAHALLDEAADAVAVEDPELAGYLRNRSRDLLSDDYESGDAAWVTAQFRHLNVQLGSYETYDDELYGAKTFFSMSILLQREAETAAVRKALTGLQAFEDSLPPTMHKKVRAEIPVGVYDVIADFGQARGGNTASILPNEAYLARRYGRTILLRANIIRDPNSRGDVDRAWQAAVAKAHYTELTGDGDFYRTLWHELGHYLGVASADDGRSLGDAADLLEEMKADLVSLFAGEELRRRGYFTEAGLRSHYASGIFRTLQNVRPRREQPYQTMQLMQMNWFLEHGVLRFDPASQRLSIDYGRYREAVTGLLREVLALQDRGDSTAADTFIARWSRWDENLHGRIAANMRARPRYRYRLFLYQALDGAGPRG